MSTTHDEWVLDGHDEGWDGQGCCPNCTARLTECNCCPLCSGDGRVRNAGRFELCPACDGEGIIKPAAEPPQDKGPL